MRMVNPIRRKMNEVKYFSHNLLITKKKKPIKLGGHFTIISWNDVRQHGKFKLDVLLKDQKVSYITLFLEFPQKSRQFLD